jgi:hypothetical protein
MTTTTGVNLQNVTAQGPITISGVTINTVTQMAARPPLWANVPARPNHFRGRDALVDALVQRLRAGQSTALSAEGLPGVGKTTLAVVLAHHPAVLAHFSDGVLWAGLGPTPDVPSALAMWANALDVDVSDQPTVQARSQIVRNVIGQRRILLRAYPILTPTEQRVVLLAVRQFAIGDPAAVNHAHRLRQVHRLNAARNERIKWHGQIPRP